jgi:hypothetical protein
MRHGTCRDVPVGSFDGFLDGAGMELVCVTIDGCAAFNGSWVFSPMSGDSDLGRDKS